MSLNSTMDALARVLKPTGGPMELDTKEMAQKTEAEKEQATKDYDAKVEAMSVPTPDELAVRALEITQRMTDFNCDFHPDEPIKYEMRQFANEHFKSIVTSIPEKSDPEDPVWKRKAREFLVACEEMDGWLEKHEDEDDYTDEDEEMNA